MDTRDTAEVIINLEVMKQKRKRLLAIRQVVVRVVIGTKAD